jgi:hypothetical protein
MKTKDDILLEQAYSKILLKENEMPTQPEDNTESIDQVKQDIAQYNPIHDTDQFEEDYPSLDYDQVIQFIKDRGYIITNGYYDGGFDTYKPVSKDRAVSVFLSMFDDHVVDSQSNEKLYFNK